MLTGNCIHPEIMRVISRLGHGDKILIADANYPLASRSGSAEKIWLGLSPGLPTVPQVLQSLLSVINIEKGEVMEPEDGPEPAIFAEFSHLLPGLELTKLSRYPFYEACCQDGVCLAIASGEKRLYANLLVTVGVS